MSRAEGALPSRIGFITPAAAGVKVDLPHWPQAAGLFVLGVLAGERRWFAWLPRRLVRRCGWLAVGGLVALLALVGYTLVAGSLAATAGGWHWPTAAFALLDGATAVVLAIWVVGWCQRRWNAPPSRVIGPAGRPEDVPLAVELGRRSEVIRRRHPPCSV